eukprot:TRINITY_DN10815_c0_g1_i1.p1 TRINITY_DN10815_c0_g1~~TRINITY_DN10815_c0_g1_i1.p1  ORF type:complete len:470 (+),score=100.69 TRINITY_DN10815_c0_g1_i1:41-1450(+)
MSKESGRGGGGMLELVPKDVIIRLFNLLTTTKNHYNFSSCSKKIRSHTLPLLVQSPIFRSHSHMKQFLELFLPEHKQFIKRLLDINYYMEETQISSDYEVALRIVTECQNSLETLVLLGVPIDWKLNFIKLIKEGVFESLSGIKVGLSCESDFGDLIQSVPCNVTTFEVDDVKLKDFRLIANHIKWIKNFEYSFCSIEEYIAYDLDESFIKNEVKFFLDQNPNLMSIRYSHTFFCRIDWIMLEECSLRGIVFKNGKKMNRLSLEFFKLLPTSISIERAIKMFHKTGWEINEWKFLLKGRNRTIEDIRLSLRIYDLLVEEFGITLLWLKFLSLRNSDEDSLKELNKTTRVETIRKLRLEVNRLQPKAKDFKYLFQQFLEGFIYLEELTLNITALKLINESQIKIPNFTITLHTSPFGYLPKLNQKDFKFLSQSENLHIHSSVYFTRFDYFKGLFLSWKPLPIPHNIMIFG